MKTNSITYLLIRKGKFILSFFLFVFASQLLTAQGTIKGKVIDAEDNTPLFGVEILTKETGKTATTDKNGNYLLTGLPKGKHTINFFYVGKKRVTREVEVKNGIVKLNLKLEPSIYDLKEVEVSTIKDNDFGIARLPSIQGTAIYASKKNEVVLMDDVQANKATNNSRQVFAKVAGLNIWESDAAGLQLGIGGRGLSPNRTSNFNTRQNGYDMSADALGYPESYYTPPTEALERIEVIRGAAGLQYGTQFGGMVNFVLKKGVEDKKLQVVSRQTAGSFGLFNTFNSVGGTVGKLNYYTFYQYKQGTGWRDNSGFNAHTAHSSFYYQFTKKLSLGVEYTYMHYLAQQAGGLTDKLFEENPRQSIRDRNWFKVNWNLAAVVLDYDFSPNTKLNSRTFGLYSQRNALGFLGLITRIDPMEERNLIKGKFRNVGNETRLLHRYKILGNTSAFVIGGRYYQGQTNNQQGLGSDGSKANFNFISPEDLEDSDYEYPSQNYALFAENLFALSPHFTVTPGVRLEYIHTDAKGYYKNSFTHPLTGEVLMEETVETGKTSRRVFPLFGIGSSYKPTHRTEIYANVSQNYRAINFNDLRISNPNLIVDDNITDETGYNADFGVRGNICNKLNFDVTAFYLYYNNRIGTYWTDVENESGVRQSTLKRSNIAAARNIGVEAFAEIDIVRCLFNDSNKAGVSVFANIAWVNARYIASEETAFQDKKVELVPDTTIKTGIAYRHKKLTATYQLSYTSSQFTDATNATYSPNAVNGIVPAYLVMDASLSYAYKFLRIETGVNNLLNRKYFTRRASGYPGPGIIPAEGRNFYVTLQVKL